MPEIRGAAIALTLFWVLLSAGTAWAQDKAGDGSVSPDSADAIRASLKRPPPRPPFGVLDAVTLPIRIIVFPVRALSWGFAEVVGLATRGGEPPAILQYLHGAGLRLGLGAIGPRSGITGQLGYFGTRPLHLEAALSIRLSQRYGAGLRFDDFQGRLLEFGYQWQRDAEPHFWGIGPETEFDQRTDYLRDHQRFSVYGRTRVSMFRFIGDVGFEDNRVGRGKDGSIPDMQDTPFDSLYGVNERVKYLRFSVAPTLDLTRQAEFQRRGLFFELGGGIYRGIDGTDSDFHRFTLTIQGYAPLNARQNLAFMILSEINREDGGQGIPFYHLASLGSHRGVRSLRTDRLRDRDMAALMTEWRFEVWRELQERVRAESFVFFDIGGVEHTITDLRLRDTRQSFGFGYRVTTRRGGRFVTYLAFGDEGPKLRVSLNTAYLP